MPRRIELERAVAAVQRRARGRQPRRRAAQVDADAGQHARQFLHVLLGVARAAGAARHAERMEFHQLARVVLVDAVGAALRVVEVEQHRGRGDGGHQQVAEAAQCMRPDRAFLIVGQQPAHLPLARIDIEVVHPEPRHLLAQLRRRVQRPQQVAPRGIGHQLAPLCIQGLAGLLLAVFVGQRIDTLARLPRGQQRRAGIALQRRQRGNGGGQFRRIRRWHG
ncbi:hypothetical protein D9M68_470750 [compost metagenome]